MKPPSVLIVVLLVAGPASGDVEVPSENEVKALVRQLGDENGARREAAHKALLRQGQGILPIIEKLGPQHDAEVRFRLQRIRAELVGYMDDIRRGLTAMDEVTGDIKAPGLDELKQTVLANQPRSGDFLLSLIADPTNRLHRRASIAFVQTWDTMTVGQVAAYVRQAILLDAPRHGRNPQRIDAGFQLEHHNRYGDIGWPGDKLLFTARTSHCLDGKPYGKPYSYRGPSAVAGYVYTKDLALGRHSCSSEMDYEFTHRGEKCTGRVRSPNFTFSVVPADAPDDLMAPADTATDRLVRRSFLFADGELEQHIRWVESLAIMERRPLTRAAGKRTKITCISWRLTKPLPVDLCFDVSLLDQDTGKAYPAGPEIVVPRGETNKWRIWPNNPEEFARGRVGEVPVKVVLTPSRKEAINCPAVRRYYPGTITSTVLTYRIVREAAEPEDGIGGPLQRP